MNAKVVVQKCERKKAPDSKREDPELENVKVRAGKQESECESAKAREPGRES